MVSAEHRLSNHFSMLANYTFAHCIGDPPSTELSGPIYTNPANRRFDRGNCTAVDVRHNFNLSAVLQSPRYASRPLRSRGLATGAHRRATHRQLLYDHKWCGQCVERYRRAAPEPTAGRPVLRVGNASGSALNSSNFGKILSDVGPRIMQFAIKYTF
jgi:hypothetical protein